MGMDTLRCLRVVLHSISLNALLLRRVMCCPSRRAEISDVRFTFECLPEELARKQQVELQQIKTLEGKQEQEQEETRQRATVDDDCPKCGHRGLEYYTMQVMKEAIFHE